MLHLYLCFQQKIQVRVYSKESGISLRTFYVLQELFGYNSFDTSFIHSSLHVSLHAFLLPAILWHLLNDELQVLISLSAAPFLPPGLNISSTQLWLSCALEQ